MVYLLPELIFIPLPGQFVLILCPLEVKQKTIQYHAQCITHALICGFCHSSIGCLDPILPGSASSPLPASSSSPRPGLGSAQPSAAPRPPHIPATQFILYELYRPSGISRTFSGRQITYFDFSLMLQLHSLLLHTSQIQGLFGMSCCNT